MRDTFESDNDRGNRTTIVNGAGILLYRDYNVVLRKSIFKFENRLVRTKLERLQIKKIAINFF